MTNITSDLAEKLCQMSDDRLENVIISFTFIACTFLIVLGFVFIFA